MYKFRSCAYCGRAHQRSADGDFDPPKYCAQCSGSRRTIAAAVLGSKPVTIADFDGDYLLPRISRMPVEKLP